MYPVNVLTPAFFNRTGTGAEETISHGQNGTPAFIQVVPTVNTTTWTAGTHDNQNVKVTVQNGRAYHLIVWFKKV